MASLLDMHIEQSLDRYLKSEGFKSWLGLRVKWMVQGFEPGFDLKDRERFTETVAKRIHDKARRPVYLFGYRIWRKRESWEFCRREAERIVTDFLRDDRIKFGDPRYFWTDGIDLADEDMSYWEACP